MTSPLFIIGTERSGSNLLRLMLNAHSRIAIPHPPHFMRFLAPVAPSYGDLRDPAARRRLVRDALRLLHAHLHPWDVEIDEDLVVAEASPTVFGVVAAIHEQYRRAKGKPRWGCKSTFMIDHVDDVLAEYPGARFVWLVRDPRDVAASSKHAVFNPYHPALTARLWAVQQRRGVAILERLGPRRVHRLHYEALVADPAAELATLCRFLDEPFEAAMLAHHATSAAATIAGMSASWRNAGRPVSRASVGRYRDALDADELAIVEHVAGPTLATLGYRATQTGAARLPAAWRVQLHDRLLRARVEWRSLRHDANHWRRWSRDAFARWLRIKTWFPLAWRRLEHAARS